MPCYDLLLITGLTVVPTEVRPSGIVSFSELTGGFRFHQLSFDVDIPDSHWTSGFPASSEVNASVLAALELLPSQFWLGVLCAELAQEFV